MSSPNSRKSSDGVGANANVTANANVNAATVTAVGSPYGKFSGDFFRDMRPRLRTLGVTTAAGVLDVTSKIEISVSPGDRYNLNKNDTKSSKNDTEGANKNKEKVGVGGSESKGSQKTEAPKERASNNQGDRGEINK
jgi:hypothetical protein